MEIKKFGLYFLLGIILVLAFKFYTIISGFVPAIASGCVLAYLFNPIYLYFQRTIRQRSLSAFMVIFIVITLILVPVIFIFFTLQKQAQFLFTEQTVNNMENTLKNIDRFVFEKLNIQISGKYLNDILSVFISTAQETVTALGTRMIFSITRFMLSTFVTIFLLYYLLKNSKSVVSSFRDYFPISYSNCDVLLDKLGKETKTLILGQLLVAIIQGSLGALGFYLFGVPRVILWGFAMVITSFIPLVGVAMVWIPACIVLLAQKEIVQGIGLFFWGLLIVSTSDNIIRPKLTSSLGKIHPVTVLLGVFIGLKEWGVIGIVIGPLFITVLINLIVMFREEYLTE
ncbi:AI-2E family transporter [Candidatus Omnitrophota bacterium]